MFPARLELATFRVLAGVYAVCDLILMGQQRDQSLFIGSWGLKDFFFGGGGHLMSSLL